MYFSERYERILNILRERDSASVNYLAKKLFVSEPTIRRDLAILESEGKVKRTFGGAILTTTIKNEVPLNARKSAEVAEKETIASLATKYLKDNMVIFLDASSTADYIIDKLSSYSDVTVITNSPSAPLKCATLKINCISTGGNLLGTSISYVGKQAEEAAAKFYADVFFFSSRGLSDQGVLSDSSMEESQLRRVMMNHSKKNVLLCTTSKIGKRYMYTLCEAEELDDIICNEELPDSIKRCIDQKNAFCP